MRIWTLRDGFWLCMLFGGLCPSLLGKEEEKKECVYLIHPALPRRKGDTQVRKVD